MSLQSFSGSSVSDDDIESRLISLADSYGSYNIIQNNGQRIFSLKPEMLLPKPPRGTEIFLGKIPRDVYEDELVPLTTRVGPIYQIRLMVDFTGRNRGYAFVMYFSVMDAYTAVNRFNGFEIRPGRKLVAYKSVDNRRLFVGKIPTDKTKEEVLAELSPYVEGLVDIIMYRSPHNCLANRGYVFLEFEEHRLAALARRRLSPGSLMLWGDFVFVDWADPLPEVEPQVMASITKLYVRNLPIEITGDQLHILLCKMLPKINVVKTYKKLDYAFVHFSTRGEAEWAMKMLEGKDINGYLIEVEWARPKCYSRTSRLAAEPTSLCTSLPPKMRRMVLQRAQQQRQRAL